MDGDMNKVVCPDCDTLYRPGDRHACAPVDAIAAMLGERRKTHGAFADHARTTQRLKDVIEDEHASRIVRGQLALTFEQMEAIAMICHKIGRIIAGDADYADHWDDIAGYAKLCSKVPADDVLMETFGPIEDYVGENPGPCQLDGRNCPSDHDHGPLTAPRDWWSAGQRTIAEITAEYAPSADEYPFTNHRTLAVIMADEHRATADQRQNAAFGEGDETTDGKHIHRWRMIDDTMVCSARECGETRPIVDQKPGQYAIDFSPGSINVMPEIDLIAEKYPCHCRDMDRCQIDNGHPIGNNVFCCKAEAGV